MKILSRFSLAALALFAFSIAGAWAEEGWSTNYQTALAQAKKEHKLVLVDFTGSDWCPPCMLMKARVFDSEAFKKFAQTNLVPVLADFPEGEPLPAEQMKLNLDLAVKFGLMNPGDPGPQFVPVLVLVDGDGKTVTKQQGAFFKPNDFIDWVKSAQK